jgi:putative nucleotidyltransferase with HDIG domain
MNMIDSASRALVVDDDAVTRQICREALEHIGCEVHEAPDAARATAMLDAMPFSVVLSDLIMPGESGIELLNHISARHPDTLVILFTGHGSIDIAKGAILNGAFDFITKPFDLSELQATVGRALESRKRLVSDLRSELYELHNLTAGSDLASEKPADYLRRLCGSLLRSFRADSAAVFLDGYGGLPDTFAGDEDVLDESTWGSLSSRAASDPAGLFMEPDGDPGAGTQRGTFPAMGHPLPGKDGRLGSCIVLRTRASDPFTQRDLKLLGLFAAHAGNQIVNYRLADDLMATTRELEQINVLSASFSSSLDTSLVLDSIVKGLRSVLPFEVLGAFVSSQGSPPLGYVAARRDITETDLRATLSRKISDLTGPVTFDKAWETCTLDRFEPASRTFDLVNASWHLFNLGEQGRLQGVLVAGLRPGLPGLERWQRYLPLIAGQAAVALGNAYLHQTGGKNYLQTIAALAGAVDAKDPYTLNHSRNVTAYCLALADFLGMTEHERESLKSAALLHDIGKIGIPEAILNKPGSLTREEFEVINTHPDIGYRILSQVSALAEIPVVIRHHHERFDGRGYPLRLAADEIPYQSRALAIADVFDAMTSDRIYRPSPGIEFAISELRANAGTQLDPDLAGAFLDVLSERLPGEMLEDYRMEITR